MENVGLCTFLLFITPTNFRDLRNVTRTLRRTGEKILILDIIIILDF
jgi:hypothetical protein